MMRSKNFKKNIDNKQQLKLVLVMPYIKNNQ